MFFRGKGEVWGAWSSGRRTCSGYGEAGPHGQGGRPPGGAAAPAWGTRAAHPVSSPNPDKVTALGRALSEISLQIRS